MTEAQDGGELDRAQMHNLAASASRLLERGAAPPAGRAPLTLVPGVGAPLKQTLLAFREACVWPNTTLLGRRRCRSCRGRVRLVTSEESWALGQGDHLQIRSTRHRLELGGCGRPLDRGRDTIQVRETPGNLSGSGPETHQHFSPADANCCQSLLLDPDATIGIDLHKRLFLLVTGREE